MNLAAVIITSSTKEQIVADAVRSCVSWVDQFIIVHIDSGDDRTLEVIKQSAQGRPCHVYHVALAEPFSIAPLRNLGLEFAHCNEADWAMQLDTDERMLPNGLDVKATLARVPEDVEAASVMEDFGRYDKPRFFRLPVTGCFKAGCHEEYLTDKKTTLLPKIRFHELEKTPEQLKAYHNQQLVELAQQRKEDPTNPRWAYYQGLLLELTGQHEAAIDAYEESIGLLSEPSTIAWSLFRIASCQRALENYADGLRACISGLMHEASFAELYWMAGLCCHFLGRPHQAIAWERSAIAHSWRRAGDASLTRYGFKDVFALFEGPYEVLAESYRAVGDKGKEQWAAAEILKARKDRERFFAKGV